MLEPTTATIFDYSIVCHAEVDLPAWLAQLTGKPGWQLMREEEDALYDAYQFQRGEQEAQVVLYHTGYALVEVDGAACYEGQLTSAPGYARLQYYNAESGAPVLLN